MQHLPSGIPRPAVVRADANAARPYPRPDCRFPVLTSPQVYRTIVPLKAPRLFPVALTV